MGVLFAGTLGKNIPCHCWLIVSLKGRWVSDDRGYFILAHYKIMPVKK